MAMAAFLMVVGIEQILEKIPAVTAEHARLVDFFRHLLWCIPGWLSALTPLAVLLGCLFSLGQLSKTREILAFRSLGVSARKMSAPIMLFAMGVSLSLFLVQEILVPYATRTAAHIWQEKIRRNVITVRFHNWPRFARAGRLLPDGSFYIYGFGLLSGEHNEALDITRFQFDSEFRLKSLSITPRATPMGTPSDPQWTLFGRIEHAREGDAWRMRSLNQESASMESLEYFLMEGGRSPEEMGYRELGDWIQKLKAAGIPTAKEEVFQKAKISHPFASFIMALLGVPLALGLGKIHPQAATRGRAFVMAILVGFSYWGIFSLSQALGSHGIIPATLAAWLANFVFLGIGIFLWRRLA